MQAGAVPEGLAVMPPGPELATLLASVELASVPNDRIVEVLQAQTRQLAHYQARQLAAMVEVARTTPFAGPGVTRRAADVYPWAGGEIAAALTLTTRTADRELEFAETLVSRLPRVFTALSAGLLDRGKAWVFADQLHPLARGLTDEQIDALCERLVPPAAGWSTGQLAARLLRAIIAIDPEHAGRRYAKAIRERQVLAYLAADGTVTITASGLPTDQAAAACERLERLAAAVKRAGHPARLAQIHAELFLAMLDGRYQHFTQAQIVAGLLARAAGANNPCPDEPEPTPEPEPEPTPEPEPEPTPEPESESEPVVRAGIEIRVGFTHLFYFRPLRPSASTLVRRAALDDTGRAQACVTARRGGPLAAPA